MKGLEVRQLRKVFREKDREAGVRDVSFVVPEGESFSLLGPSGCGKSTTLRMIGGLEEPESGSILLDGRDITRDPPQKRDIRTVFQRYALFPHLNVVENVAFGLRMKKLPGAEIERRAKEAMELLEISRMARRPIQQLSGGEQQRVALARALITEPSILLLDEPLSALDLKLRERMQMELLALRKKLGMTFLFVTHDQGEAMALSESIGVMNAGRLEQVGCAEEIYQRPLTRFVASFIGQANFFKEADLNGVEGSLPSLKSGSEWMLRPETLHASAASAAMPSGHVGVKGVLRDAVFLGQERLLHVVLPSGLVAVVRQAGSLPLPADEGETVRVHWPVESLWSVQTPNAAG